MWVEGRKKKVSDKGILVFPLFILKEVKEIVKANVKKPEVSDYGLCIGSG